MTESLFDILDNSQFFLWDNSQKQYGSFIIIPPCIEIRFVKIKTPIFYKLLGIKHLKWRVIGYLYNFYPEETAYRMKAIIEKRFSGINVSLKVVYHSEPDMLNWGEIVMKLKFDSEADEANFLLQSDSSYEIAKEISSISFLKI